jgi:ABC-2 type transport system permease protein
MQLHYPWPYPWERVKRRKAAPWALWSWLDIIMACMWKDIRSALADRISLFQMIVLPLNYNMLLILFALAGSAAPTAVVMLDTGPYAQRFYDAMNASHSFRLQVASSESEATAMLLHGDIVAVVTVPADFDQKVGLGQPVQISLFTNNLNTDFTDDVDRGLRLAVTAFYQRQFPAKLSIVAQVREAYGRETDYIPYLSVSVVVIGLLVGGLLQAGNAMARDWELNTIKEVLLSPAPGFAIVVGKMLGAGAVSLISALAVILFLVLVIHVWPLYWTGFLGTVLLMSAVSVAAGTLVGNLLKQRQSVTLLTRGSSVPLFFLSGVFNPITYSTIGLVILARLFPVHYAIALIQQSALGFTTNTLSPGGNTLVLVGFLLLFVVLSSMVLRRGRVAH